MRNPGKKSLDRRTVLAGASTVGAVAAAAVVLPLTQQTAAPLQSADVKPASGTSAGYRLTEHVKRYYASTRI
jgi:Ubiquitinol-cytochrome C reductase Fe-S subunit TAT signal